MSDKPELDQELAHKFFAANCFNKAWELIDKPDRTPEDDEQMIRLVHASIYHWTQRPDCTRQELLDRLLAGVANLYAGRSGGQCASLRQALSGDYAEGGCVLSRLRVRGAGPR